MNCFGIENSLPGRCDIVIPIFTLKSESSTFQSANRALSQYLPGRENVRCYGHSNIALIVRLPLKPEVQERVGSADREGM